MDNKKHAVISLSGGLDSSTLLLRLLKEGYQVQAISFDYGQKHKIELEKAVELVGYLNELENKIIEDGDKPPFFPIAHQIIKLEGLSQLLDSALVEGGEEIKDGVYNEDNMKDTVVPNRNKIFSSIIQSVALSIAQKENTKVKIAMGVHAGDHGGYPDTTSEFRDKDYEAFLEGNWGGEKVEYYTPYIDIDKNDVLKDGEKSCEILGLDFDDVYVNTFSSYKPIKIFIPGSTMEDMRQGGGETYYVSDYKSSTSIERIQAFINLGRPDPIDYGDDGGIVDWKTVKKYVKNLK